jgi:hypothetical protein
MKSTRGAVYVEFLIAFMPVLVFFMCLWQMSRMYTTALAVQHAAVIAARSGAVVFADDPQKYNNEPVGQISTKRREAVEGAALFALAPFILDGSLTQVKVTFPSAPGAHDERTSFNPSSADPNASDGQRVDFVRVHIEATFRCHIPLASRIACSTLTATRTIQRDAAYPYQGASYDY